MNLDWSRRLGLTILAFSEVYGQSYITDVIEHYVQTVEISQLIFNIEGRRLYRSKEGINLGVFVQSNWPRGQDWIHPTNELYDPTTKCLLSMSHLLIQFCRGRVFCYWPTVPYTSSRLPMYRSQIQTFYHFGTTLHNFFHLSTYSDLYHASDCCANRRSTASRRPRHRPHSHLFCCPSTCPQSSFHPSRHTSLLHSFFPRSKYLHIYYHPPRFQLRDRVDNHQTISPSIWHRCSVCIFRFLKPCRLSSPPHKYPHLHARTFLNQGIYTLPIGLAVLPLPLVLGPIWPHLHSVPPSHISHPFSLIDNSIFKFDRFPPFNLIRLSRCDFTLVLFLSKILLIFIGDTGSTKQMEVYQGLAVVSPTGVAANFQSFQSKVLRVSLPPLGFSQAQQAFPILYQQYQYNYQKANGKPSVNNKQTHQIQKCTQLIELFKFCRNFKRVMKQVILQVTQMQVDKASKNKRNSLDPNKNTLMHNFKPKNPSTEPQVKLSKPQISTSNISNQEQYSNQDLQRIFAAISQGKQKITVQDLYSILNQEGYSECLYSSVEMIALVDEGRKGYLTRKEFMKFFTNKTYVDEEQIPPLTQEMKENRKWVKAIQENWMEMKDFADPDYCKWFAQKIRQHQKSKNI